MLPDLGRAVSLSEPLIELEPERLPEGTPLLVGETAPQPSAVREDTLAGQVSPGARLVFGPTPHHLAVAGDRLDDRLPERIRIGRVQGASVYAALGASRGCSIFWRITSAIFEVILPSLTAWSSRG